MNTSTLIENYDIKLSRKGFGEIFPFQSHFIEISGYQMHFIDEGEGDTILMLHGNPTWSFYYRNLIDHFRANYRVVVPDHIGYGFSDKPEKYDYTVGNQVTRLEEFAEKMDLTNLTLVLHDWGGAFGMGYAVRHPTNIKRLVFLNTGAFRVPDKILKNLPWELMVVRKPVIGPVLVRGFNAFSRFAIQMAIKNKKRRTSEIKAGYLAPYNSWKNRVAVLKAVRDIPLSEDAPAHKELAYIEENLYKFRNVPKIFFWGLKDFVFTDVVLKKWLEFYPGSEVRTFEDAGHYVLDDAYDRIIPNMEQFLINNPIN